MKLQNQTSIGMLVDSGARDFSDPAKSVAIPVHCSICGQITAVSMQATRSRRNEGSWPRRGREIAKCRLSGITKRLLFAFHLQTIQSDSNSGVECA